MKRLLLIPLVLFLACEDKQEDTTAPTIVITYPANSSTLTETTTVTVDVVDDGEIGIVKLLIDGIETYTDTTSPYQFEWDVCVQATGTHTLMAKTEDDAGNKGQSDLLTFTIDANYDCESICGGDNLLDNCEVCDADISNDCTTDCNGEWGGDAIDDMCGTCDDDSTNDCVQDCANVWGGTSWLSDCGCVSINNSGDDCDDCAGVPNGNAEILTYWYDADNDGLGTGESQQFCNVLVEEGWVLNGDDIDDNCISNVHDCEGICDGEAMNDNCEQCVGGNTGVDACVQDCTGLWGGSYTDCSVYDIDGNGYTSVIIGSQVWLVQNLKVTHYNDGTEIPTGYSDSEWSDLQTGAYSVYPYDDDEPAIATCNGDCSEVYGNLYNWYAIDDTRGICPEGWNVPTDGEIKVLEMYLGMSQSEADGIGYRGTNEGSKLAGRADFWNDGDLVNNAAFGTSEFEFLPGGYRINLGGNYDNMGSHGGYFWSSTESNSSNAWNRKLDYNSSEIGRSNYGKSIGFSVRCIRDSP
jgi:uncharacterized protein (TIGR02145 family)